MFISPNLHFIIFFFFPRFMSWERWQPAIIWGVSLSHWDGSRTCTRKTISWVQRGWKHRAAEWVAQITSEYVNVAFLGCLWPKVCVYVCVCVCGGGGVYKGWLEERAAILFASQSSSLLRRPSVSWRTPPPTPPVSLLLCLCWHVGLSLFPPAAASPPCTSASTRGTPLNPHWSRWFQAQASFSAAGAPLLMLLRCGRLTFPLITPVIYSCAFFQRACCANLPKGRFCGSPLGAHGWSI